MKRIDAFIKTHRLEKVSLALHHVRGFQCMTVAEVRGFGREDAPEWDPADFHEVTRLEIFCPDELAEQIVTTIERAAHTGLEGDGKIYVSTVDMAVRISTGERGEGAV